jgi:preprotein translocase subunit SecA
MHTAWAGRRLLSMAGASGAGVGPMIPGLSAALVDEADAVLIDEGVVPLIIARARREDEMSQIYRDGAEIARRLDDKADYKVDHVHRRVELTRRGKHRTEEMCLALSDPIWNATRRAEELVRQALVARHCYLHGHQYQIVDGRVVIVDEYTGRFLPDRSWEHGLHQAVEAKEGLDITADRETLARLSFQRFFRMYPVLCGMTGTVADAKIEMERVYHRPITIIPTNRPVVREKWPERIFKTSDARWSAVVESILDINRRRRPILVGSRSIQASELIASRLSSRGIPHRVLNANFDKEEAELIGLAGHESAITVATNMAGRGTDIKPDPRAIEAGGLHVMLTEMHSAKRIDRQFIGRAGRQGDPGSSQMFMSLEDELVRLHAPGFAEAVKRMSTSDELSGPARSMALAVFRLAQRRAERRARSSRADVLRQDDWIDQNLPGR